MLRSQARAAAEQEDCRRRIVAGHPGHRDDAVKIRQFINRCNSPVDGFSKLLTSWLSIEMLLTIVNSVDQPYSNFQRDVVLFCFRLFSNIVTT